MPVIMEPPGVWINGYGPRIGNLSIDQERLDVTTFGESKIPDPEWTYVDQNGHFHAWNLEVADRPKIFTADERFEIRTNAHSVEPGTYCEACEYGDTYSISLGWFCVLCAKKIPNPGLAPDPNPVTSAPGRKTWQIEFENQDGFPGLSRILQGQDQCSIRIPRIHAFGIASCSRFTWDGAAGEHGGWNFTLFGTSPLGRYGGK